MVHNDALCALPVPVRPPICFGIDRRVAAQALGALPQLLGAQHRAEHRVNRVTSSATFPRQLTLLSTPEVMS